MRKSISAAVICLLFAMSNTTLAQYRRSCATMEVYELQKKADPGLEARRKSIEDHTTQYVNQHLLTSNAVQAVVTIPVVFHVVYSSNTQNVSDAQLMAQLDQLNLDFALMNSDKTKIPSAFSTIATNSNIQFCLAQRTPAGAVTTGIERRQTTISSFSTNDGVKKYSSGGLNAWDATKYLNIWVCNMGGGILGYAQFPGGPLSTDGVVLAFGTVGSMLKPGSAAPYNLGRTGTHEVGHWLNLYHIWGDDGSGCSGSDAVGDTPNQGGENYGCPTYPKTDACTSTSPGVMFMNYMDYTDDNCMYMFTSGQSVRMNALFASGGQRNGITTSTACVASTACGALATATVGSITTGSATISWTAASNANSYAIRICPVASTVCFDTTVIGTSVSLSGLSGGTSYSYSITPVCTSGNGTAATGTFMTLSTSCGDVTNLTSASITSSGATLSWTAVTGALSYNIQYKTSTATTWTTTTSTTASKSITGLSASTIYNWQVQTVCNGLSAAYVAGNDFTTAEPPVCSAPVGLASTSVTSSGVTLSWTAVTGASSYNIQYKTAAATSWTTVTSTTASRALTGLAANTTYNWQVQTLCTGANSSYTAGSNFTTLASTTCTDIYESNNKSSTAKTISTNTDIRGLISSGSDRDWFRFSTTSPNTNIRVTLTNLAKDYDLRLYNSGASVLATSAASSTTSESITRNTTVAATYLLQVYPYSNTQFSTTQCYTLRVNVASTIFRLDAGGSVVPEYKDGRISIYPNPAQQYLNIELTDASPNQIAVYDINGREVFRKIISKSLSQVDLKNIPAGMYLIKITDANGKMINQQKFLKN
jgi:hypothetical protein